MDEMFCREEKEQESNQQSAISNGEQWICYSTRSAGQNSVGGCRETTITNLKLGCSGMSLEWVTVNMKKMM